MVDPKYPNITAAARLLTELADENVDFSKNSDIAMLALISNLADRLDELETRFQQHCRGT